MRSTTEDTSFKCRHGHNSELNRIVWFPSWVMSWFGSIFSEIAWVMNWIDCITANSPFILSWTESFLWRDASVGWWITHYFYEINHHSIGFSCKKVVWAPIKLHFLITYFQTTHRVDFFLVMSWMNQFLWKPPEPWLEFISFLGKRLILKPLTRFKALAWWVDSIQTRLSRAHVYSSVSVSLTTWAHGEGVDFFLLESWVHINNFLWKPIEP